MAKTIEFYFLSCIGIILQFLFLSILKEYDEEPELVSDSGDVVN